MSREQAPVRDDYRVFYPIPTRWADNDIYGHVNNVTYYSYFDTAANRYLIEAGGLDISDGSIVGYVVNSGCAYHAPVAYPDELEAGLRVDKLGNSSVQYGLAIFRKGEQSAVAHGHFVHVFVARAEDRAVPVPENIRTALEQIRVDR
ncbi:acyl-CoA thioesterase [Seongchinamella sediminis]|uniref:Acyl-CoA thioesterase n=1 Tax=Seongchinamella sediminis TaxID=2283635 RepID=A0A3L7DSJ0_9GAMM|nr:thioesterase family protein [Seongchinamella sediminis]RLQ20627.1 acyl-CoA thioesterase [Seongchinamella sediminis]